MLGRSALLAATNVLEPWQGNYSNVSLLLRGNGTPSGTLVSFDESPNPISITTTGTTGISTTVFQYGASSLFFPNNSSIATTVALSAFAFGSGDFTIEFWMRVSSPTWVFDYGFMFGIGNYGSGASIVFAFNGSNFGVMDQSGWGFSRFVSRGTDGVFHHVALARASSVTRFFYDGILVGTTDLTTQSFGNSILYLNRVSLYSNSGIINGLHIDDLRITKGIARYQSAFTPPPAELPANITDDPDYNSVSLLLRGNETPLLVPLDESPTPKTITKVGDAGISTTLFKYGSSSLVLDGSGDSFTAPSGTDFDFGTDPFTVEFWAYLNQVNKNYQTFFSLISGVDFVSGFSINTWLANQPTFAFYNNSESATFLITGQSNSLTTGVWYHIAVTRDTNNVFRLFLDGVKQGTDVTSTLSMLAGKTPRVGAWTDISGRDLNGYIDDLRITKGIARYQSAFTPPPAELPNF